MMCWHDWSEWRLWVTKNSQGWVTTRQKRTCEKCGKVQSELVCDGEEIKRA